MDFPTFIELYHLHTAVKFYFFNVYYFYMFCYGKVSGNRKFPEKFPGSFRPHLAQLRDKSVCILVYSR